MGQMTAVRQAHAQNRIPRIQQSKIHCGIRLCAGMCLYIGKLCIEQLLCPLNGNILNNIHALAAAVVTLAGVALCILIGQN